MLNSFKLTLYGCVVCICCVGFASLDVVCREFHDCIRNLSSVCMFTVSKALLISSATVIVSADETIWLNPCATVLFSVCSSVTVECPFNFCIALLMDLFVLCVRL